MNLRNSNWLVLAAALSAGLAACGGGGNGDMDGGDVVTPGNDSSMNDGSRDGGTMDGNNGGSDGSTRTDGNGGTDGGNGGTDGGNGGTDGGNGGTDGGNGGTDGGMIGDGGGTGCTPVSALNPAGDTKTGTLGASGGVISVLGCSDPTVSDLTAGEQVYSLHITQTLQVSLDVTTTDANLDTVIAIRQMCTVDTSEVACNDDKGGGDLSSATRAVLAPGDYVVIVDAYTPDTGTGLDYTLTLTSTTPAANADCTMATMLTSGTPVTGQNTAGGGASSDACDTFDNGNQLFYALSIPPGQRATITATPDSGSTLTPVIRVLDSCTAASCRVNSTASGSGMPAQVTLDNRTTAAESVIVSVSGTSPSDNGTFSVSATLSTAPAAPANAMCSMAMTLANGGTATNQDPSLGSDDLSSVCDGFATGNVLYYSVSVPAGQFLTATATPTSGLDVAIRQLDMCGATTCAGQADSHGTGTAETLRYHNTGTTAKTLILAVGATDPGMTGTFDLSVNIASAPLNAVCTTATLVMDGSMLMNQDSTLGSDTLSSACESSADGTVLYYRATVLGGKTLTVTVTPTGDMDPVVRLLPMCGATTCLTSIDANASGEAETLTYMNSGTTPTMVVIAVGAYSATSSGTFNMSVTNR